MDGKDKRYIGGAGVIPCHGSGNATLRGGAEIARPGPEHSQTSSRGSGNAGDGKEDE